MWPCPVRPARQDIAYSLEDDIYLAVYTVWQDPDDDEKYCDWARSNMAAMSCPTSPLASSSPTRTWVNVRPSSSLTQTWRAWTRSERSMTHKGGSTAGWDASEMDRRLGYRDGDADTPFAPFFNPEIAALPRHVVEALEHGPQAAPTPLAILRARVDPR
jgi:hypothetical protein